MPAIAPEQHALRRSLIILLRAFARAGMTLEQLALLVDRGVFAPHLGTITVEELRAGTHRNDEEVLLEILGFFQRSPEAEISAAAVARILNLRRWRAQRLMGELEAAGHVERTGKTASTRFRLSRGGGSK